MFTQRKQHTSNGLLATATTTTDVQEGRREVLVVRGRAPTYLMAGGVLLLRGA